MLTLALVHLVLVEGVCLLFVRFNIAFVDHYITHQHQQFPVPPLYRTITRIITLVIARLILLLIGLLWIPVEYVTRKRG